MKKKVVAFYDIEESYRTEFIAYLEKERRLPFTIMSFADAEALKTFCMTEAPECIVVSESAYEEGWKEYGEVVVLKEGGYISDISLHYVDKYQSADNIVKEMLAYFTERADVDMPLCLGQKKSRFIGIYSPVKRCLQTSTALAMGQILAKKKKVLYISFEHYSVFAKQMEQEISMNLVDLVFYMKHAREKLIFKLRSMIQTINALDYIPPAVSFLDLYEIPTEEWLTLLAQIGESGGYDYILLDLHECLNGIFDILQFCDYIYTIEKNDGMAYAKIHQYEQMLLQRDYGDILERTRKLHLPCFKHIPVDVEQLLYSELAEYVKTLILEEGL